MPELAVQQTIRPPGVSVPRATTQVRVSPKLRWQVTQIGLDLLTVFAAAMLTYSVYLVSGIGRSHFNPLIYAQLNIAFSAVTVFALHGYGGYRDELGLLRIDAVRKILRAVFAGVLLTLGLSFVVKFPNVSRITVIMLGPTTMFALAAQRFMLWWLRDRSESVKGAAPVLVYGAGETGRLLAQRMLDEHQLDLVPVGFLDDEHALHGTEMKVRPGLDGKRLPVYGGEESLRQAFAASGSAAVFVAMPSAPSERITHIITLLESLRIPFFFVPSAGDLLFSTLRFGQVAGMPVFARRTPGASRFYGLVKRAMDVLGSICLLVLTSPLMGLAALLVRLSSPGPVLFTQERVGLDGKPFTVFKLRTMRREAPPYARHPSSASDDRVTRTGHWLRRFSIDELPQLVNVLRGEMSLVGPRPEMPFVAEEYSTIEQQRLTVKPGVTGLWQISADRAFSINENIQYDLYYIENRSVGLDLAILLVTPFVLLAKNRAW
jgi:exopolysaccharide biosynthesis polyprenyl glycosylphosphotransferase